MKRTPKQVSSKELLNRKNLGILQGDHHFKGIRANEMNLSKWEYLSQKHSTDNVLNYIKEYKPKHYFSLGDIFDKTPPLNVEQELFDKLFGGINSIDKKINIHMIQGNHSAISNSTKREYYKDNLKEWYKERYNINLYGYEEIKLKCGNKSQEALMCSHKHINKLEALEKEYPLVFSHFRSSDGNVFYTNEISLASLKQNAEIVICGDIHKRLAFSNIVYTGSSWQSHFPSIKEDNSDELSERERPSILVLDLDTLEYAWLSVIKEKFQKKTKQYFLVQDFLDDISELEKEHEELNTFFKIKLSDTKVNLSNFKGQESKYKFCIFETEAIDLLQELNKTSVQDKTVKELFEDTSGELVKETISKNLLEYIVTSNKDVKYQETLLSTYATLEGQIEV